MNSTYKGVKNGKNYENMSVEELEKNCQARWDALGFTQEVFQKKFEGKYFNYSKQELQSAICKYQGKLNTINNWSLRLCVPLVLGGFAMGAVFGGIYSKIIYVEILPNLIENAALCGALTGVCLFFGYYSTLIPCELKIKKLKNIKKYRQLKESHIEK